jgi:hypothetical protein
MRKLTAYEEGLLNYVLMRYGTGVFKWAEAMDGYYEVAGDIQNTSLMGTYLERVDDIAWAWKLSELALDYFERERHDN